ncbi:MAG: pyrroline-5-carboxylate reductase [Terrisporobacter sp.]|uniref:pyrroline-5-carboxylate reductase n=1 Tax=Terrisporobacter sp. TaxID=1965305 RepID=UPI002FC61643
MSKKIGFIGCGNMGKAMLLGLLKDEKIISSDILISTKTEKSGSKITEETGIKYTLNNYDVAKFADILFLAVKPNMYESVINEIKDIIEETVIVVTIAAGINISSVEAWFEKDVKIIKTMPNTPAMVGEGMSAICSNKLVEQKELDYVCSLYNNFGKYEILAEKDFHAFIALCGSSPAYVFMFIEAMADAAVKLGIPRAKAYTMAEQSILGSAKLALETGKHPGELKDMVCSPGGTTIEAVIELESKGFRNSVISAMEKCAEKSKNM